MQRRPVSADGLALASSTLIPFDANGQFGLHPRFVDMTPFNGQMALVANVGTLVQPTTRAAYVDNTSPLPNNLFSHADQQGQMQSSVPSGLATTGAGAFRRALRLGYWRRWGSAGAARAQRRQDCLERGCPGV